MPNLIDFIDFENYIKEQIKPELDKNLINLLYKDFFSNVDSSSNPTLVVLGGSPGAGKTYYRRKYLTSSNFHIHDMDEVLVRLPGYLKDCRPDNMKMAFEKWWPVAQKIANAMVRFAFAHHLNVIYDRTCGTEESFLDIKAIHAKKEYYIMIYAFNVSEKTALARVKEREKKEARTVTPEITKEYMGRFSALWPHYITLANQACVFDNNNSDFEYTKIYEKKGDVEKTFCQHHYLKFLAPGREIIFNEKFPRLKTINRNNHFSPSSCLIREESENSDEMKKTPTIVAKL